MEWWLLTFFLGAILSLFIPVVPEISLLFLILVFSLLLFLFKKTRPIAMMVFGACWVLMAASQYQSRLSENNVVLEKSQKESIIIRGAIANIVHQKSNTNRFNFLVSHWQGRALSTPFLVRLNWKLPIEKLQQGQRWQLLVKLKPAHGLANIGSFNYQTWLKQQDIVATGYVKPSTSKNIKNTKQLSNILLAENISWRQHLYQKLAVLLAEKPLAGLLLALGFGERGELTKPQWQVLSATATVHLIAISGLHIGIIAFFSFISIRALIKVLPLFAIFSSQKNIKLMRVSVKYLPILLSCTVAWYYAYLAGYSIPTLRALVMLFLFWLLKISAINVSLIRWLLLSILVILLFWPLSLLSASFWMSISALSIIFASSSRFLNQNKISDNKNNSSQADDIANHEDETPTTTRWLLIKQRFYSWGKALIVIQLALTVCMLPIAASLNYQLPLMAFFANIIAVPLMSVTTIPLTLFAVISLPLSELLSQFFLSLAYFSLELVWLWLSYISELKWAQLTVSNAQLEALYLIVIAIFSLLYFRVSKLHSIFVAGFVALILSIDFMIRNNDETWQLSVFDVGHGLAVVIEKNNRVFIYDTGASYPSGFNMAEAAILPYLKYRGFDNIDIVMLSHNDNDHAGGLKALREQFVINEVIANDSTLMPDVHCIAGHTFSWQGLAFEVLSPVQVKGDKNDDSCVVTISDGFHRVLLPGDISTKQEKRLLNNDAVKNKLASDILIAPHHGSKSSSNQHFLAAVAPKYAVFSAGYLNRWQMPSEQIQRRYQKQNIATYSTAEHGMVSFMLTSSGIEPLSYRQDLEPYWFVN